MRMSILAGRTQTIIRARRLNVLAVHRSNHNHNHNHSHSHNHCATNRLSLDKIVDAFKRSTEQRNVDMQRVRGQLEDIVKTELQYISTMITDISNAAYETSDTDQKDLPKVLVQHSALSQAHCL